MDQLLQQRVSQIGQPSKDLLDFKEEISRHFREGETVDDITKYLKTDHHLLINGRTVRRRLREWGVTQRTRTAEHHNLDNQIMTLFFQCGLSDNKIYLVLRKQGFKIGPRGLRDRRRRLGLHRRLLDYTVVEAAIREAVQNELNKGSIEGYDRGYLHTYFRSKQHIISR